MIRLLRELIKQILIESSSLETNDEKQRDKIYHSILYSVDSRSLKQIDKKILDIIKKDQIGLKLIDIWKKTDSIKNESADFLLTSIKDVYEQMTEEHYFFPRSVKENINEIILRSDSSLNKTKLFYCRIILEYSVTSVILSSENMFNDNGTKENILGNNAFAEDRNDVPFEKDTSFENDLYKSLMRHFNYNNIINPEYVSAIKSFLKDGKYSDIFHEPKNVNVYRGMTASKEILTKFLGFEFVDNSKNVKFNIEKGDFSYITHKNKQISSWTSSKQKAIEFNEENNEYDIVLVAKVSDNPKKFIECNNGLYKVNTFVLHSDEKEILGIDDIKVHEILWKKHVKSLSEDEDNTIKNDVIDEFSGCGAVAGFVANAPPIVINKKKNKNKKAIRKNK